MVKRRGVIESGRCARRMRAIPGRLSHAGCVRSEEGCSTQGRGASQDEGAGDSQNGLAQIRSRPPDGVGALGGGRVELGCARGAACGLDWDFGAAIGTFGGIGGFLLGFSFDAVDGFDQDEYGEGNDKEL